MLPRQTTLEEFVGYAVMVDERGGSPTPGDEGGSSLGKYYESMAPTASQQPHEPPMHHVSRVDWSKFEGHGSRSAKPRNLFAWVTFGVLALYLAMAAAIGFALIGIAPLILSYRSWSEDEPLALVAVIAAVAGLVAGLIIWPIF